MGLKLDAAKARLGRHRSWGKVERIRRGAVAARCALYWFSKQAMPVRVFSSEQVVM